MKKLLDHGYLDIVESYGSDERVIEAARMSTDKGFEGWGPKCPCSGDRIKPVLVDLDGVTCERCGAKLHPGDEKLLEYLYKNAHDTPFEMAGMIIEVKAPIFVFREWHRHRTQSYNEMSSRYSPLPDENYLPSIERLMINSKTNKQAGTIAGAEELTEGNALVFRERLKASYANAEQLYQWALKNGVPKELARVHLPVGRYSKMRAAANLRNWLAFMTLRSAPSAQWEIRQFSIAVGEIIREKFPRTYELFCKYPMKRVSQ